MTPQPRTLGRETACRKGVDLILSGALSAGTPLSERRLAESPCGVASAPRSVMEPIFTSKFSVVRAIARSSTSVVP